MTSRPRGPIELELFYSCFRFRIRRQHSHQDSALSSLEGEQVFTVTFVSWKITLIFLQLLSLLWFSLYFYSYYIYIIINHIHAKYMHQIIFYCIFQSEKPISLLHKSKRNNPIIIIYFSRSLEFFFLDMHSSVRACPCHKGAWPYDDPRQLCLDRWKLMQCELNDLLP